MSLSVRTCFFLYALFCLGLLGSGLILGEVARLQPCHLCNLQRLYYMLMALFALCGAIGPRQRRLWAALVALMALGGMITAIQQSWMQFMPQQATECGFGEPTLAEQLIDWLGMQWPAMFMVTGFCTVKDWTFLGLSLANWSTFCFLGLFLVAGGIFFWRNFHSRWLAIDEGFLHIRWK